MVPRCAFTHTCARKAVRGIYNQRDWRAFECSGSAAFSPSNGKNVVDKNPRPLNTLRYVTFAPIYEPEKMKNSTPSKIFSF